MPSFLLRNQLDSDASDLSPISYRSPDIIRDIAGAIDVIGAICSVEELI